MTSQLGRPPPRGITGVPRSQEDEEMRRASRSKATTTPWRLQTSSSPAAVRSSTSASSVISGTTETFRSDLRGVRACDPLVNTNRDDSGGMARLCSTSTATTMLPTEGQ
uniref:Uncharacterized protein n=1 Tax=Arundo donax TaxID=35708 RepID=A0A0A8ZUH6_ARUDO